MLKDVSILLIVLMGLALSIYVLDQGIRQVDYIESRTKELQKRR